MPPRSISLRSDIDSPRLAASHTTAPLRLGNQTCPVSPQRRHIMSGYDDGYYGNGSSHRDQPTTDGRGFVRKPVASAHGGGHPPTSPDDGLSSLPSPAAAVQHAIGGYDASRRGTFPVSPASSTPSPAPEAQWRHEEQQHRRQAEESFLAREEQEEEVSNPPQQQMQGQQQQGPSPATTESTSQWRISYQTGVAGGRDTWQDAQRNSRLSWQAAPRAQTSSQSPPIPDYQEFSAAGSQRRDAHELAKKKGEALDPNHHEVAAAASRWRNSREHIQPIPDGGPWQGDMGNSQTQHPKYRDIEISSKHSKSSGEAQEELPAGRVPEPLARTIESQCLGIPAPGPPPIQQQQQTQHPQPPKEEEASLAVPATWQVMTPRTVPDSAPPRNPNNSEKPMARES